MQAATSAAAKHMNNSLVNQAIAAMYQHPQLHDHVVGWAPVRSGQLNSEVHLPFFFFFFFFFFWEGKIFITQVQ